MIRDWQDEDGPPRAEPFDGAPDQSEIVHDVGVILAVVLGGAVLASLLLRLSGG